MIPEIVNRSSLPRVVRVAIPRPIRRLFDYVINEHASHATELTPGLLVRVPFGASDVIGVITEVLLPTTGDELKAVTEVITDTRIPAPLIPFLTWAAEYYQHPPGEVLPLALPPLARKMVTKPTRPQGSTVWFRTTTPSESTLTRSPRKQAAITQIEGAANGMAETELIALGYARSLLRELAALTLIQSRLEPLEHHRPPAKPLVALTAEQHEALRRTRESSQPTLIFGITGSGKTEIYLHLIDDALKRGEQALFLVPEINLTPQMLQRVEAHFPGQVASWHSGISHREKMTTWQALRRGDARILVGTRSAIFLPFATLGLILVDEEHDASFKQQEGFRYSARDLAIVRARMGHCRIVLGSATPALETLENANLGRYTLTRLTRRANAATLPSIQLLDIRSRPLEGGISPPLFVDIQQTLAEAQQALIFINRRGFSPIVMCYDCGHIPDCPRCDARLSFHKAKQRLRCHHCLFETRASPTCTKCQGEMHPVGHGTERCEEVLTQHFPETPIIRIDSDVASSKSRLKQALDFVHTGAPCILVGTQMLAKGHDFSRVSLVGVLDADGGLFSADYRATERTAQTLVQVAGRAGRAAATGRVIIQSCQAEHPLMTLIARQNYEPIARWLLDERQSAELPPFNALCAIRCEGSDSQAADTIAQQVTTVCRRVLADTDRCVQLIGPLPALMLRRAGKVRMLVILKAADRARLRHCLRQLVPELDAHVKQRNGKWAIDVDPTEPF